MSTSITASQLLCACGVSYNIGSTTPITQEPYYTNSGFTSTPATFQAPLLPQTAGCLIGQTDAGIIIAFRGTELTAVSDWATDLLVEPLTVPGFPGIIHTGFYLSTMELMPQILSTLQPLLASPNQNTPVAITGHSKGGGMASLAAWYLQQQGIVSASQLTVTTFASPNPGDNNFAAGYQATFSASNQTTNYINWLDVIPFLPPGTTLANTISGFFNGTTYGPLITAIMADFAAWNYTPAAANLLLIESATSIVALDTWNQLEDLAAIGIDINSKDYSAILDAHSHLCGGGYFSAICPEITCVPGS